MRLCALFALVVATAGWGWGQYRVDPGNLYERVIAVVPLVGAGTEADPQRPMFAPDPGQAARTRGSGILAFGWMAGDDGRTAIVEFVARDRAALREILESRDPRVKVFRKGKGNAAEVLTELQRVKRDFRPEALRGHVH